MNGRGRFLIRTAAAVLFLLLLAAGAAGAAKERTLKAGCPSRCGETVNARFSKGGTVLSLPGSWDLSAVTLELEGSDILYLGHENRAVRAGEPADLSGLAGQSVVLKDGQKNKVGKLRILQGSEIPALFLTVDAEQLKKVNRSKKEQITTGRAAWYEADGSLAYDGGLDQLKGRGNNTFAYSKKPYQLKLSEKASLSGMGRGRTWVLLANWTDISLLRNQIVLDMSVETGLRCAVRCAQADVWINGNYQGLYLVTEKIQAGRQRIPVRDLEEETEKVNPAPFSPGKLVKAKTAELPLSRSYPDVKDPEDITGGYIFTVEKYHRFRDNKLAGFRNREGLSVQIKEPTCPSPAQTAWLGRRVTEMQHALMAADGRAPETGKDYGEYLDSASFARKYLIEEWCKNYDFMGGSQFMYKDSDAADPLIYAGPAWDYDLSFGNMKDRGYSPTGNHLLSTRRDANLYWLLYGHEAFRRLVGENWRTVFRPAAAVLLGESPAKAGSAIRPLEEYRDRIAASAAMNYTRWGVGTDASAAEAGGSFDNAVKYLGNWIARRTEWMDGKYGADE